jgi:hypothetical protein
MKLGSIPAFAISAALFACAPQAHLEGSALMQRAVPSRTQLIPTRYIGDRFFATPITPAGDTIPIFLDTAGGTLIWEPDITALGLTLDSVKTSSGAYRHAVALPAFRADRSVPPVVTASLQGDKLLAYPISDPNGFGALIAHSSSMQLGQLWFDGRSWLFDYPRHQLALSTGAALSLGSTAHSIGFDFQTDSMGNKASHTPRMSVVVDGDSLKMLFDTGASIWLTDDAMKQINDGLPKERATSHIRMSLYKKWHARHPDWRVIEHGDQWSNADLIVVPTVRIAGFDAGPVLFSALLSDTSSRYVAPPARARIDGMLGGSALRYFTVAVDYPRRAAQFLPAEKQWTGAQVADSARVVLAGDPVVAGKRIKPYTAHWTVTYQMSDGRVIPGGPTRVTSWFDTVSVETVEGRSLLHRRQILYAPDGSLLETLDNWVDAATLIPTRTVARYGSAKLSVRQFDRDSVWGVDPDSTAPGGERKVSVRIPQPIFDFYGGLFDVFVAALPLRPGLAVRIPTDDPTAQGGSGLTWATITVIGRDTVATAGRGNVAAWRAEANAAGQSRAHFVFWIADKPPYLIRMWYVGPHGGKQVWDIV